MAGYQRFVAYVYEYRKGKKDGSSGYVRVEARDRRCRVEVYLRCAGLEPGSRCRIYGFVRREGLMDGILMGSCVTGRERIECALETDTEDIGSMGKNLKDLGGLILISEAGGFWGTEWDDQPIRPENFREWKKEELPEDSGQEKEEATEQLQKENPEKQNTEKKNPESEDRTMTAEEIREVESEENRFGMKPPKPPKPPEPPKPHPGTPCDPFRDGQFAHCQRIKPSDCSLLCRKNGCFCNNRFVIYGYQNFGHLLLCRDYRGQYILGVPGSYSQQERFMAEMFGFPYFKESPDIRIPGGKGGYWYCFIQN